MKILDMAKLFFGEPYIWGGDSPIKGMDCSGFVLEVLRSLGYVGRGDDSAQGIYNKFKNFEKNAPVPGSLLFFGKDKKDISHIAIAVDEQLMIEAGGGDHTTTSIENAISRNAYIRIRPIKNRPDLVAIQTLE